METPTVHAELNAQLWRQFGAAIDMLDNAIAAFPADEWADDSQNWPPWYLAFHTLFWLDYYLTTTGHENFHPPAPFGLEELDPAGVMPPRTYSQAELQQYLAFGREKCRAALAALSPENPGPPYQFRTRQCSFLELQIYNLRHVQHGAAQLNLILRQRTNAAPPWAGATKHPLATE